MEKHKFRDTDLALERKRAPNEKGVLYKETTMGDIRFSALTVTENAKGDALPVGKTLSVSLPAFFFSNGEERKQFLDAIRLALQVFFPILPARLLVAGLGNRRLTADALGPMTAERIDASAALPRALGEQFKIPSFTRIAVSIPDVFPRTGIESVYTVRAAARLHKADAVLTVDALAAREKERLLRVIEITDTGSVPGGGVKRGTLALSKKTLGVPVVAIGVPTVVRMGEEYFLVSRGMEDELHVISGCLAEAINLHFGGESPIEGDLISSLFEG